MPKHPAGPVLVSGARGGFASAIIPNLQSDFSLRLTDLPGPAIEGREYRPADLMNFSGVCAVMEGVDAVVHPAVAPAKQFETREDIGDKLDPYAEDDGFFNMVSAPDNQRFDLTPAPCSAMTDFLFIPKD